MYERWWVCVRALSINTRVCTAVNTGCCLKHLKRVNTEKLCTKISTLPSNGIFLPSTSIFSPSNGMHTSCFSSVISDQARSIRDIIKGNMINLVTNIWISSSAPSTLAPYLIKCKHSFRSLSAKCALLFLFLHIYR